MAKKPDIELVRVANDELAKTSEVEQAETVDKQRDELYDDGDVSETVETQMAQTKTDHLMVTAATIYMSLLGFEGLANVAKVSHANTALLVDGLCAIDGVERLYEGPFFHEVALRLNRQVAPLLAALADRDILGGFDLTPVVETDALLVCATETKTEADIEACVAAFADVMAVDNV